MRLRGVLLALMALPANATTVSVLQLPSATWRESYAPSRTYERVLRVSADGDVTLDLATGAPFFAQATGRKADLAFKNEAKVTITKVELKKNLAQFVTVSLSNVEAADVYEGAVAFRDARRDVVVKPLTLDVRAKPSFVTPTLRSFARVEKSSITGWLACLLLGREALNSDAKVIAHHGSTVQVDVHELDAIATGVKTERVLSGSDLQLAKPGPSKAGVLQIPLRIPLDRLPPDRYSGNVLVVTGAQSDAPLTVPFEISIRAAPGGAIIALAVGILFSILVAHMNAKGDRQAGFIERIRRIESELSDDDRKVLQADIESARRKIYGDDMDAAETAVAGVEKRANGLSQIAAWIVLMRNLTNADPQLMKDLHDFRVTIAGSEFDETQLADLGRRVRAAAAADTAAQRSGGPGAAPESGGAVLERWLDRVDLPRWRAEAAPVLRSLLRVTLVVGLVYAGLAALYVTNATFGVNGLADYVSLFLWGLASDATSKKLTDIQTLIPNR